MSIHEEVLSVQALAERDIEQRSIDVVTKMALIPLPVLPAVKGDGPGALQNTTKHRALGRLQELMSWRLCIQ